MSSKPLPLSRRALLRSGAGLVAAASLGASAPRKKVAILGTEDTEISHLQNIVDRLLLGYSWEGGWRRPEIDVVSIYVDQFPKGDLARARTQRFGTPIFKTIRDCAHARRFEVGGRWRPDHRRARQIPSQRERSNALSPLRVFQRGCQSLRNQRPQCAGLQ